jgi:hypothetical protein
MEIQTNEETGVAPNVWNVTYSLAKHGWKQTYFYAYQTWYVTKLNDMTTGKTNN